MLDELEKTRCALDEAIAKLHVQLENVLKEDNSKSGTPCENDCQTRSDLCRRIETHTEQLVRMIGTIESITNRLDIPT